MKHFLIVSVSLLSNLVFSQEVKTEDRFAFESKLIKISNTDSITNYLEKIKQISVADIKDTTTVFDKNSKWELILFTQFQVGKNHFQISDTTLMICILENPKMWCLELIL